MQEVPWEELRAALPEEASLDLLPAAGAAASTAGPTPSASSSLYPVKLPATSRRPAPRVGQAILRPLNATHVSHAVKFAQKYNLPFSVKSGGHNPEYWSDAGLLVVDLQRIDGVEWIHEASASASASAASTSMSGNGLPRQANEEAPTANSVEARTNGETESSTSTHTVAAVHANSAAGAGASAGNGEESGTGSSAAGAGANATSASPSSSAQEGNTRSAQERLAQSALADVQATTAEQKGKRKASSPSAGTSTSREAEGGMLLHSQSLPVDVNDSASGAGSPDLRSGSDPEVANARTEGKRQKLNGTGLILANSYPPMALTNADPSSPAVLSAQSRPHAEASTTRSTPFNFDVGRAKATFPDPPAPGMIAPFEGSKTEALVAGSGSALERANPAQRPGALLEVNGAGSPLGPGTASAMTREGPGPGPGRLQRNPSSSTSAGEDGNTAFGASPDTGDFKLVRFGAGCRAQALDAVTSAPASGSSSGSTSAGYFVPQACYPVGTAIFSTGGYGFLSRLYGLSMDNVASYELVLPSDGRIVILHEDWRTREGLTEEDRKEQEELWFVMRGAGTAFAVITRITARAYRVGKVLAGNVIFPFNSITTPSLIRHWRDCIKGAPRALYTNLTLTAGPDSRGHVVILQFSWVGSSRSAGESILSALLAWEGERCLLKDVEVREYAEQQANTSQILASKAGTRWLVRSTLIKALADAAVHDTVKKFSRVPSGTSWLFENAGGRIGDQDHFLGPNGDGASCFNDPERRNAPIQIMALHQYDDSSSSQEEGMDMGKRSLELAHDWIYGTFADDALGPFPCFLGSGEGLDKMIRVYGQENWNRLKELKRKYDPNGLLRFTHFEDELLK